MCVLGVDVSVFICVCGVGDVFAEMYSHRIIDDRIEKYDAYVVVFSK